MKRLIAVGLGLGLGLGTPSAHAESHPHYGGSVDASLLGAPASLDPVAARSHAELTVVGLVFDTLYGVELDGNAAPHLADSAPTIDAKAGTARIPIHRGVRFHDGSELTARDVAASLDRARAAAPWLLPTVSAVRVDGEAVELTLRAPTANLATLLAQPQTAITPGGKVPAAKPIGSGPFAVTQLDSAQHRLSLRAFDAHFAGRPYLDAIVLHWYDTPDGEARAFEAGSAQLSARGVTAFAGGQPLYRAEDVPGPVGLLEYIGFSRARGAVTSDTAFRSALDLALSRTGLGAITSGERVVPTRWPVPAEASPTPAIGAAGNPDLAAARAQLADAARRVPALAADKLSALRLSILVEDTRPDDRELAEHIVQALDSLGISAAISAVSAQVLRDRIAKGQADLWIGELAAPRMDAAAWWAAVFAAGGDDALVAQEQAGAIDPAAAAAAFTQHLPIVALRFRAVRISHRTDVRGVAFDGLGRVCFADLFLFGAPVRSKAHP